MAQLVLQSPGMASRTVRARLDAESEDGLAVLMREGRNESEAVRAALVEAAERRRRRSALRAEAQRLADDERDRAEARALLDDLGAASPDRPA